MSFCKKITLYKSELDTISFQVPHVRKCPEGKQKGRWWMSRAVYLIVCEIRKMFIQRRRVVISLVWLRWLYRALCHANTSYFSLSCRPTSVFFPSRYSLYFNLVTHSHLNLTVFIWSYVYVFHLSLAHFLVWPLLGNHALSNQVGKLGFSYLLHISPRLSILPEIA